MLARLAFLAVVATASLSDLRSIHENWEDVSMICAAAKGGNIFDAKKDCEFPVVTARNIDGKNITSLMRLTVTKYDADSSEMKREYPLHLEGVDSANSSRYYDGDSGLLKDTDPKDHVNFAQTGYYLFNYTAVDETSRSAEDVVFALFIDDQDAPVISGPGSKTVEACNPEFATCNAKALTNGWSAQDEVYGDVSASLKYNFSSVEGSYPGYAGTPKSASKETKQLAKVTSKWMSADEANAAFKAMQVAPETVTVTVGAHDNAGAFGSGGEDNKAYKVATYKIVDTTPPKILDPSFPTQTPECCAHDHSRQNGDQTQHEWAPCTYNHGRATAMDSVDGPVALVASSADGKKVGVVQDVAVQDSGRDVTDDVLKTLGEHSITYTAADKSANTASIVRKVNVIDTTPPYLLLTGAADLTIHRDTTSLDDMAYKTNMHAVNRRVQDVKAWDDCSDEEDIKITYKLSGPTSATDATPKKWSNFQKLDVVGTFTVTYTATENRQGGLSASITRTINVVNEEKPIISLKDTAFKVKLDVLDADQCSENRETSKTATVYQDPGAKCADYLGQNLYVRTVSDGINRCKVGTYKIEYTCQDAAGNQALPVHREVIVEDREAPTCDIVLGGGRNIGGPSETTLETKNQLLNKYPELFDEALPRSKYGKIDVVVNTVEAGFPFKDPSCTPKDNYDSSSDLTVTVSNDPRLESASKAWTMASCAAIAKEFNGEGAHNSVSDGWYFITTPQRQLWSEDTPKYLDTKTRVYCLGMDTATPLTHKQCVGSCSSYCYKIGLVEDNTYTGPFPAGHSGPFCTVNSDVDTAPAGYKEGYEAIIEGSKMTPGEYTLQYTVSDKAGNTNDCFDHKRGRRVSNCKSNTEAYIRVVKVTDTLAPVITLHDRRNENNVLFPSQLAGKVGGWTGKYRGNPFLQGGLMAEQSQVNGWALAAAACAVAGLALVGYSSKRTTNFVPV